MWKLLSKRDRRNVRKIEEQETEEGKPAELAVLTTAGVREYSCVNCARYSREFPEGPSNCVSRGVPPDTMPCTFSPKRPELFFQPKEVPPPVDRALKALDLPQMLILRALLDRQIDLLVAREALALPYRQGELVTFVHAQTLCQAEVVDFDDVSVTVRLNGEDLMLPHATVIPPKRKIVAEVVKTPENHKDSATSELDLKESSTLHEVRETL